MSDTNGLTPLALPNNLADWSAWIEARCADGLAEARRLADQLTTSPPADATSLMRSWNEVNIALSGAFSAAGLIAQVHPDEDLRTAAEASEQQASKLATDLTLDVELYKLFARVEANDVDPGAARVLAHTLRDFRRAGVDKDEATRGQLRELADREIALSQQISKNTRDSVLTVRLRPEQLRGLPWDYVEAHPVDADGSISVTTDYPDVY
ncbi:MAG: M3 family metallopeptidase, partial [Nocardioidaceae bacterium]